MMTALGKNNSYRIIYDKGYFIQKLDNNLNTLSQQPLPEIEYGGNKLKYYGALSVQGIIQVSGSTYITLINKGKGTRQVDLLIAKVNENLTIENPNILLTDLDQDYDIDSYTNVFGTNQNRSYIFHYYRTRKVNTVTVFNGSMQQVWQSSKDLPHMETASLMLSEDGKNLVGIAAYDVVVVSATKPKIITAKVNEGVAVQNPIFSISNNTILLAGTYFKNSYTDYEEAGVYLSKYYLSSHTANTTKYYAYNKSKPDEIDSADNKVEYKTYTALAVSSSDEGEINIVSERNYTIRKYFASQYGTNYQEKELLNEKIVTGINNAEAKSYELRIDDKYLKHADYEFKVAAVQNNNKTYLIYLGGKSNRTLYTIAGINSNGKLDISEIELEQPIDLSRWRFATTNYYDSKVFIERENGVIHQYGIINLD